jgi:prophage maintenance system killer protein
MEACRLFLDMNGYIMLMDDEVIKAALDIANGQLDLADFTRWIEDRTFLLKIDPPDMSDGSP